MSVWYAVTAANRSAVDHGIRYKSLSGEISKRQRRGSVSMQLSSLYLWLKALHIAFMVTWFAGLFYLPRLFIYHAESDDLVSQERFTVMENRLFGIMTIGASLTAILGFLLMWTNPAVLSQTWFHIKLALLAGLVIYHVRCRSWIVRLSGGEKPSNTRGLRLFNEIPVVFLLGIIILAVLKAPQ